MTGSHLTEIREMIETAAANEIKAKAAETTPCPWCCPVTCRNCEVKGCVDRIAGGEDAE